MRDKNFITLKRRNQTDLAVFFVEKILNDLAWFLTLIKKPQ